METRVRLRPEIETMVPYRQGAAAAEDAFKLSSNENPFAPLPGVLEEIAKSTINRYPDGSAAALRRMLGAKHTVSPERIQVGAGSVSVLSQLITAAAGGGDEVVYPWRSFEAYPLLVATAGATSVAVPNLPDHRHDLPAMLDAITDRTRLVIVCSPNNPTSTIVTQDEFTAFMAAVPSTVLVVLDEAYIEFVSDPSVARGASLMVQYSNLVVLRTFSKAYGLAGLRIGYAFGSEYVMDAARCVAIPLSVTEPAQRGAIASLQHEPQLLERIVRLNETRGLVWDGLLDQGWDAPEPHGNFVWLPFGGDTASAAAVFARNDVIVRALGGGVRVSIGEAESVEKLLQAAGEVLRMRQNHGSVVTLD